MLKDILLSPIKDEMARVEACIRATLSNDAYDHIAEMNAYLLRSPGKRVRPMLVLFCFKATLEGSKLTATKDLTESAIKMAAAIELIHMASLVHDDIIDHAELRHDRPAFYKKFGTDIGMTMGVYLYSQALTLIAQTGNTETLQVIGNALTNLCRGEITQLHHRNYPSYDTDSYLQILSEKTGVLFAAACHCGAILAGASPALRQDMSKFGNTLGIVFQIADDYMDIMGDQDTLGKTPGQDFEQGEITLLTLYLLDDASEEERQAIITLITSKKPSNLAILRDKILHSQAPQRAEKLAKKYIQTAQLCLKDIPQNKFKKSLYSFVEFIEKRTFKR